MWWKFGRLVSKVTLGTEVQSSGEWLAFTDSSWQCYYMLGTATRSKLSMPFQVLGLLIFLGLGLRLPSKKYRNKT